MRRRRMTFSEPSSFGFCITATVSPFFKVPEYTRPIARRPRYSEASRLVTSACKMPFGSLDGAGSVNMQSSNADRSASAAGIPTPTIALPSRATALITWKASCSSVLARSRKSCSTSSSTSCVRASWRSTLFSTTIAGRFASMAFDST